MKDISDWILFYQRFLHLLGDMYRFVHYRVNLPMSPKDDWDTECNRLPSVGTTDLTTDSGYGPDEILCPDGSSGLSPVFLFIYETERRVPLRHCLNSFQVVCRLLTNRKRDLDQCVCEDEEMCMCR